MAEGKIPKDHLSASSMNMFLRCGMQYYFRYCEERKNPPASAAMSLGSSFHVGIEHNHKHKLDARKDLPLDEVLDAFSDDFTGRRHETAWYPEEDFGAFKDMGVGLVTEYQKVVAPNIQPAWVERDFEIKFKDKDWTFTGRIDMVDEEKKVMEAKTIGRTPPRPESEHMLQTTGYVAGFRKEEGKEEGASITYAVKNKTPKIVSYDLEIGDSQIDFFLGQVSRVATMIKAEMFIPNRNSRLCTHRWCGYASICEKVCGGVVPER